MPEEQRELKVEWPENLARVPKKFRHDLLTIAEGFLGEDGNKIQKGDSLSGVDEAFRDCLTDLYNFYVKKEILTEADAGYQTSLIDYIITEAARVQYPKSFQHSEIETPKPQKFVTAPEPKKDKKPELPQVKLTANEAKKSIRVFPPEFSVN